MNNFLAWMNLGVGLLIAVASIPLILKKIPMNRSYGVRFAMSYKSDANWYAINYAGGWILLCWSLPIIAYGAWGFTSHSANYPTLSTVIIVACVLLACLQSYFVARRIDRANAKDK